MLSKHLLVTIITAVLLLSTGTAFATFSIVAVDTTTGAVGGAGASCIDDVLIINDIIESVGAVHTQAWWNEANQDNAHVLLGQGLTPDSIITWLNANDAAFRPELRQYGVVTLAGSGASASFTGEGNDSWAGHRTGPGYAIQGNILLGPEIVDSMEFAFLNTDGPLEEKLMAALEAAKVPGADSRCLISGKSAISAFIKVVRPGDGPTPYLFEVVPTSDQTDPIDMLRAQYDAWKLLKRADPALSNVIVAPDVIEGDGGDTAYVTITPLNSESHAPIDGVTAVELTNSGEGTVVSPAVDNGDGTFSARLISGPNPFVSDQLTISIAAGDTVITVLDEPVVLFYGCADINFDQSGPDIADLVYLVSYMFQSGAVPPELVTCDINGDHSAVPDIADLVALVTYMFQSGSAPICH